MDTLAVAIVRSSHGVKGFVKVLSFSGETAHLLRLRRVELNMNGKRRTLAIEEARHFKNGALLKFEGIESPEAAKALSGAELWVLREEAAPLAEDEYYLADLCDCELFCGEEKRGRIISVAAGSAGDLLEVETKDGVRIVPFTRHFIGEVDLSAGRVELLMPELLA
jgi:16S rRNA processing protein RimM